MPHRRRVPASLIPALALGLVLAAAPAAPAQRPDGPPGGPGAPRGFGGPGGPGGPGGFQTSVELVKKFDQNHDGRLDTAERKAAREFLAQEQKEGRGPRRPGPPGMRGGGGGGRPGGFRGGPGAPTQPTPAPGSGPKIVPAQVKTYPSAAPFDDTVLRTFFVDFEEKDWEAELAEFYHTDVDVPAQLTIDGQAYPDVGVHFRGASSFFTVGEGLKRSLNVSFAHARKDQRFHGVKTLNLLNSHTDPTFLRSLLYLHVANHYLPAARANLVHVVINGESWGIFVAVEQVDRAFIQAHYQTTEGHRWKVPGSPRGRGTLAYLGDDPADYRRIYSLKTKEDPKAWTDLIRLCRVLGQTPMEQLEAAVAPLLDLDGALRFLALENVFINNDGYWIRNSDYNLYEDPKGRFHLIPHDTNETFRDVEGGPGFGGGGQGVGVELDPLSGAGNPDKPLISRLLAVPALRERYLAHVRAMADTWLDWKQIGPLVARWQGLIDGVVRADVHKLYSYEAFQAGVSSSPGGRDTAGGGGSIRLVDFCAQRRAYLLAHTAAMSPDEPKKKD